MIPLTIDGLVYAASMVILHSVRIGVKTFPTQFFDLLAYWETRNCRPSMGEGALELVRCQLTGRQRSGRAVIPSALSRLRTKLWKLGRRSCLNRKGTAPPGILA